MLLSDAVGAVRAVRLLLLSDVGLLLSGAVGWSAVGVLSEPEHTSHTYDTIKRSRAVAGALTPMTPAAATQLPPSYGVITPAAAAAWAAPSALSPSSPAAYGDAPAVSW